MHIEQRSGTVKCIRNKVIEEFEKGWIGSNTLCEYHPCHYKGQDCTYCYCPFYPCNDPTFGKNLKSKRGNDVWDCSSCLFIHRQDVCRFVSSEVKRLGITVPEDDRLPGIFEEAKRRFFRPGKAIMVLGATSDAGKSLTVAALCRIISDMGYTVTPLKTQNMSLNSVVTHDGSEIAMIQGLQSKAAGIKRLDHHINPVLLKPRGNTISQVMVNGKPFGDYNVSDYYSKFVPGPGVNAVRESIEYLKNRYDYVVIEGAGSPAEINIYDRDIANMRAAEMADADCILVVNTAWGGSFAYAVGTIELLQEKDRKRIKGIIFNNLYGDPSGFRKGADELEKMLGIPVLGIIPHLDLTLPNEDSEFFRTNSSLGSGKTKVAVIRLPKISNFTDIDPLYMEDVTVKFADRPEDLEGCDAIVIPGTKNTIADMQWMRSSGMADAILKRKGKVPIAGICGGYQMMGRLLVDKNGIENGAPAEVEGLGLFNNVTRWDGYTKNVRQTCGTLLPVGGDVFGYEIHMGETDVSEDPLFKIDEFKGSRMEGSLNEKEMLFGTYMHGVFDKPAFRRYFLSFAGVSGNGSKVKDYSDKVEENIQKLADGFKNSMDMEAFVKIFMEVCQ